MDLSVIEKCYGLTVRDFSLLSGSGGIYKVCADEGDFVLKPKRFPDSEFTFIAEVCAYLRQQGQPVAEVVRDENGRLWQEIQDEEYFLMAYLPGRAADFHSRRQLAAVAAALAQLHTAGSGFHSDSFADRNKAGSFLNTVYVKINDMKKWQHSLRSKERLCYFDFLYRNYAGRAVAAARQTADSLTAYYDKLAAVYAERGCICHHDLAHHNIMIDERDGGRQVNFIDFDYCVADIFVHDLASILLRIAKANDYRAELPLRFLRCYEEHLPLGGKERRLLWDYMCFPQDFWQLGLAYYEEVPRMIDGKAAAARRRRLERRLTAYADSFEQREEFLQMMKGVIL